MTNEETIAYFKEHNESLVSCAKNENVYDYDKQVIEADYMRRCFEANEKAIRALEQQPSDDCISREAVDNYIVKLMSGYLYDEERTRLEDLTAYIWELPSVTPQQKIGHWEMDVLEKQMSSSGNPNKWIPVSERLPEENISVIGTTKYDDIYETELYDDCGDKKWYADGCYDVPIVAWLPLPEPYKAERTEE